MRTSLRNVLSAASSKRLPLPAETAAFVALVVAERLAPRPGRITSASVLFSDGGQIGVASPAARTDDTEAAEGLRAVLGEMLAASPAAPEALRALAARTSENLTGLRRTLEALLAPLNRPVSRRILERWLRDALRGVPQSHLLVEEQAALRGEPSAMEAILEDLSAPFVLRREPRPASAPAHPTQETAVLAPPIPVPPGPEPPGPSPPVSSLPDVPSPRRARNRLYATITLLVLGLAGTVLMARPEILDDLVGADPGRRDAGPTPATSAPVVVRGTLTVAPDPEDAEILLYVGRGPAEIPDVSNAPVEIVVRGDDGRAVRTAVAERATEVAVQLPEEPAAADSPLPRTAVAGDPPQRVKAGRTVRVVTNPAGARVYLRVASVVPDLDVSAPHELLVAKHGHEPQRVVVAPSDWRGGADGSQVASAAVKLRRVSRHRGR